MLRREPLPEAEVRKRLDNLREISSNREAFVEQKKQQIRDFVLEQMRQLEEILAPYVEILWEEGRLRDIDVSNLPTEKHEDALPLLFDFVRKAQDASQDYLYKLIPPKIPKTDREVLNEEEKEEVEKLIREIEGDEVELNLEGFLNDLWIDLADGIDEKMSLLKGPIWRKETQREAMKTERSIKQLLEELRKLIEGQA